MEFFVFLKNYFLIENTSYGCPRFYCFLAVLLVFGFTELIKWPIKRYAVSKIKNEKVKKCVNSLFIILALGIGVGIAYIYQLFGFTTECKAGFTFALCAITGYELISRVVVRIQKGDEITAEDLVQDFKDSKTIATQSVIDVIATLTSKQESKKDVVEVVEEKKKEEQVGSDNLSKVIQQLNIKK